MTQPESVDRTLRLLERGLSEAASSKTLQWLSVPAPLLQAESLLSVEPTADAWYWSSGGDQGVRRHRRGQTADRSRTRSLRGSIDRQLQELWGALQPHASVRRRDTPRSRVSSAASPSKPESALDWPCTVGRFRRRPAGAAAPGATRVVKVARGSRSPPLRKSWRQRAARSLSNEAAQLVASQPALQRSPTWSSLPVRSSSPSVAPTSGGSRSTTSSARSRPARSKRSC